MKTEKTQIHFLSDVLVAVAPLDLKVPMKSSLTLLQDAGGYAISLQNNLKLHLGCPTC